MMTIPSKVFSCALAAVLVAAAVVMPRVRPAEACSDTSLVFLGQICTFPFDYCPAGYAPAYGQFLSIFENQALFSLLGTFYGGDGQTTFALPDLRSRTAVGAQVQAGNPFSTVPGETGGGANTDTYSVARSASGVQVPNTQLPFLGVTYCVALQGVYPSRP